MDLCVVNALTHLIRTITLGGRYYYCSHVIEEETEVQREQLAETYRWGLTQEPSFLAL